MRDVCSECGLCERQTAARSRKNVRRICYLSVTDLESGGSASGSVTTWMLAPPPARVADADTRPLCVTTIFCTIARPRPVPVALGGEERPEDALAQRVAAMPGPLSLDRHAADACAGSTRRLDADRGRDAEPAHASTALRNRLLNACRSSTSSPSIDRRTSPSTSTCRRGARRPQIVGGALTTAREIDRRSAAARAARS